MPSNVTAADHLGATPVTAISCPDAGNKLTVAYHRQVVAALLANDALQTTNITSLGNTKVNRAGDDAITGRLTITPSGATNGLIVNAGPASNQGAIIATGNGIGVAISGNGGTNGAGASFSAGGGNNFGVRGAGMGNEVGGEFTGGTTGSGIKSIAGTAATTTAPTIAGDLVSGGLRMTTVAAPNANVNPGADAVLFPQNMITSTAIVESDGAGNFAVRNNKGFNVASFSGDSSGVGTITFVRNLLGNDYRMHTNASDGYSAKWNGVQNTGNYQFVVRNQATNATINLTTTAVTISVTTVGF